MSALLDQPAPARMGCCNPRPWQPICVGCPDRKFHSGNPYAGVEGARPVVTVELPVFEGANDEER